MSTGLSTHVQGVHLEKGVVVFGGLLFLVMSISGSQFNKSGWHGSKILYCLYILERMNGGTHGW